MSSLVLGIESQEYLNTKTLFGSKNEFARLKKVLANFKSKTASY